MSITCIQGFGQASHHSSKTKRWKCEVLPEVSVFNKYGDVHIITWDKDSVVVKTEVKLSAKNNSKLDKLKNNIDVSATKKGRYIICETKFGEGNQLVRDVNIVLGNEERLSINYTLYIPKHTVTSIDNKFGSVYLSENIGRTDISILHGELRAQTVPENSTISLKFGDLNIKQANEIDLLLSNVDAYIKKGSFINLESRFSTIEIDQTKSIKLNSRRDKIRIGSVEKVKGDIAYTKFNAKNLLKEVLIQSKFGDFNIEKVNTSASIIYIDSKYTDIELNVATPTLLELDITHRKTTLSIPDSENKLNKTVLNDKKDTYQSTGVIGKGSTKIKMSLKTENSYLRITQH